MLHPCIYEETYGFCGRAQTAERRTRRLCLGCYRVAARPDRGICLRELRGAGVGPQILRRGITAGPAARPAVCMGIRNDARRAQARKKRRSL